MMNLIRFHQQKIFSWFRGRMMMKQLLLSLFKAQGHQLDCIDFIFCSDDFLLSLNQQFLHHDTLTDIITFDLSDDVSHRYIKSAEKDKNTAFIGRRLPIVGEIYISIDRVTENAESLGQPRLRELQRVMIHGALHLCGYTDKRSSDKQVMRAREDFFLKKLDRLAQRTR